MEYIIYCVFACGLNLVFIPIIIGVARKFNWFDDVNERKIHTGRVPRLGGVGIVLSFFISLFVLSLVNARVNHEIPQYGLVGIAMVIVHIVGLIDDFKDLRAKTKFVAHLAAALLVTVAGYRFKTIFIPWLGVWDLGLWSYPLTIIWIVGVINALNMIDGLDGLSGGIGVIASFGLGMIFLNTGQVVPSFGAIILLGALIGYLVFNFPPAKTFMGDSGSTFLGFTLAVLPLLDTTGREGLWFWDGVTVLLLPIYDVFAAMIRRAKGGVSLMSPDRWHFHHKLLGLGLSVRSILYVAYSICLALALVAISSLFLEPAMHIFIVVISWLILLVFFLVLHYRKERSLANNTP